MASSWVLKFPRSDDNQSYVLVHVSHKGGHADLDLTLLGTEGEMVYKTKRACVRASGGGDYRVLSVPFPMYHIFHA
jgi:hypothetical protein